MALRDSHISKTANHFSGLSKTLVTDYLYIYGTTEFMLKVSKMSCSTHFAVLFLHSLWSCQWNPQQWYQYYRYSIWITLALM